LTSTPSKSVQVEDNPPGDQPKGQRGEWCAASMAPGPTEYRLPTNEDSSSAEGARQRSAWSLLHDAAVRQGRDCIRTASQEGVPTQPTGQTPMGRKAEGDLDYPTERVGPSGFEPESPAPQAGRISCGPEDDVVPGPKPSYPTDPLSPRTGTRVKKYSRSLLFGSPHDGADDREKETHPAKVGRQNDSRNGEENARGNQCGSVFHDPGDEPGNASMYCPSQEPTQLNRRAGPRR
jgi:hypothetical protein